MTIPVSELTVEEFKRAMRDYGWGKYTDEGYAAIYEYLMENDRALNVPAVCCNFTEFTVGELIEMWGGELDRDNFESEEDYEVAIVEEAYQNARRHRTEVIETEAGTFISVL